MKFSIFLPFIVLVSCSISNNHLGQQIGERNSESLPDWVSAPYTVCHEDLEFCASGEGVTQIEADMSARSSLASIFNIKVSKKISFYKAIRNNGEKQSWGSGELESFDQSMKETLDEALQTVEIKKRFYLKDMVFSLASLNREKVARLLKLKISRLDSQLKALWSKKNRLSYRKIKKVFLEIDELNQKHLIVWGQPVRISVTLDEIFRWRNSLSKNEPLTLKIGQAPEWLIKKVKEILTEAGYKMRTGDTEKGLSLNVEAIKEFLNVKGFEKYTFTLHLSSLLRNQENKTLSLSETVTGRNQEDALLKVKKLFINYLDDKLDEIGLR